MFFTKVDSYDSLMEGVRELDCDIIYNADMVNVIEHVSCVGVKYLIEMRHLAKLMESANDPNPIHSIKSVAELNNVKESALTVVIESGDIEKYPKTIKMLKDNGVELLRERNESSLDIFSRRSNTAVIVKESDDNPKKLQLQEKLNKLKEDRENYMNNTFLPERYRLKDIVDRAQSRRDDAREELEKYKDKLDEYDEDKGGQAYDNAARLVKRAEMRCQDLDNEYKKRVEEFRAHEDEGRKVRMKFTEDTSRIEWELEHLS
jgi:hypothetical protein